jgi:hypothetical protein
MASFNETKVKTFVNPVSHWATLSLQDPVDSNLNLIGCFACVEFEQIKSNSTLVLNVEFCMCPEKSVYTVHYTLQI